MGWKSTLKIGAMLVAIANTTAAMGADRVRVSAAHRALWDTGLPIAVAEKQGFFSEENLNVDVTYVAGGPEAIQALIIGEQDIAVAIGMLASLGAISKGVPVKIIAPEFTGSDMYWFAKPSTGVKGLSDLANKTVGHNLPGTAAHLAALALNDASGGNAKLVMAGRMPDNLTQVLSDQIDVGYSVPPYALDRIESGELVLVARGTELSALNKLTTRVVLANSNFLEENRDVAVRYMRAIAKAHDWMYSNPDAVRKIYADLNGVSDSVAKTAIGFYSRENVQLGTILGLEQSMELATEYGFLKAPLTAEKVAQAIDIVLPDN